MQNLSQIFSALSDMTRLSVVERLMAEGELSAGDLLDDVGMSAPAMSRHLKVLRRAGLVQVQVDGTRRLYSVRPDAMKAIADWTLDHRAFWQAGLDRLEVHLALEEKD
ncbi:ArsR/SmtB family transcription factor [Roseovarius aestuarii]|uniref:HTH-type transcriptional regulator n=1 Tax=Roseovarius aestuarii TaxID=475083 RepID=A0A1X7BSZ6_9RHOB|nr:metalloregulator ArsR/SmtB family transcription factor [Roseovarius aestuarii]SMC12761.1 HTH-type transcriptional regulator [Roseovarius aestuarii]